MSVLRSLLVVLVLLSQCGGERKGDAGSAEVIYVECGVVGMLRKSAVSSEAQMASITPTAMTPEDQAAVGYGMCLSNIEGGKSNDLLLERDLFVNLDSKRR
jgi:hypothetical protein